MGWTGIHATHYKNGKVDRKAEMDEIWTQTEHDGYPELTVLKSQMVGSTYYAAVRKRKTGEPDSVYGVVGLTSIDMKDWFNFTYKEMSEDVGPYESKCPMSILKLLTPTEHEWALQWRQRCSNYHQKKKDHLTPGTLPVGTVIKFKLWNGEERIIEKKAPAYQFRRNWWYVPATHQYYSSRNIPKEFEIVKEA